MARRTLSSIFVRSFSPTTRTASVVSARHHQKRALGNTAYYRRFRRCLFQSSSSTGIVLRQYTFQHSFPQQTPLDGVKKSTSNSRLFVSSTRVVDDNDFSPVDVDIDEDDQDDDEQILSLEEEYHNNDDNDNDDLFNNNPLNTLAPGTHDEFFVVKQYITPPNGFDLDDAISQNIVNPEEIQRCDLSTNNVTLPIALMILDPIEYPSLSKARKACRKGLVMIHRGGLLLDETTGNYTVFDKEKCIRGRTGDRVYSGDVVAKQVRMGTGSYPHPYHKRPPFDLPVVYEDDHFAIVNKPAGVVTFASRNAGDGLITLSAALLFTITPPKIGTYYSMRRPTTVHRLDKPTSGLILVAKTKPSILDLGRQFEQRKIQKTYTAIVNGIPLETNETRISSAQAYDLGVDVGDDPNNSEDDKSSCWNIIDFPLQAPKEETKKQAVTVWRTLRYIKSLKAKDNTLTMVELKPKTGRYHQLRRHMAWVSESPLVGDKTYDGGGESAFHFRDRGLFLCSNRVILEHPYYNSERGRKEWNKMSQQKEEKSSYDNNFLYYSESTDKVMVKAEIDLPCKFDNFMTHEEERAEKFSV